MLLSWLWVPELVWYVALTNQTPFCTSCSLELGLTEWNGQMLQESVKWHHLLKTAPSMYLHILSTNLCIRYILSEWKQIRTICCSRFSNEFYRQVLNNRQHSQMLAIWVTLWHSQWPFDSKSCVARSSILISLTTVSISMPKGYQSTIYIGPYWAEIGGWTWLGMSWITCTACSWCLHKGTCHCW